MKDSPELCGEHQGREREYWCLDDRQLVSNPIAFTLRLYKTKDFGSFKKKFDLLFKLVLCRYAVTASYWAPTVDTVLYWTRPNNAQGKVV